MLSIHTISTCIFPSPSPPRCFPQVCKEEVEHNKMRAIRALVELLATNPKQNLTQILQVVANKLGDPARKVAAHAMYCLRTLLQRRPALKSQVLAEVEVMLYR